MVAYAVCVVKPGPGEHRWQSVGQQSMKEIAKDEGLGGGGRSIDLVATRSGRRVAFEIETGKSDAAINVQKCLEAGMDKVIVVATSRSLLPKLQKALPADVRVELRTAAGIVTGPSGRS